MKQYRELTGDDVLQVGDKACVSGSIMCDIDEDLFGRRVSSLSPFRYCRPVPSPAEITAAERVRFEAWVKEHSVTTDMVQRDQGGGYAIILAHWSWQAWCAAVGCDPMGDVNNG